MLDQLEPEVAGVTLDTGNLVMRLDDPVELANRLAPRGRRHPRQGRGPRLHPSRALLAGTAGRVGDSAAARHSGPGDPANPAITLSIELHPRTYDLPIFDRKWLAYFPDACARLAGRRRPTGRARAKADTPTGRSRGPKSSRQFPGPTATSTGWPARWVIFGRSSRPSRGFEPSPAKHARITATLDDAPVMRGKQTPLVLKLATRMDATQRTTRRIVSLDQFRGYTVAGMLFVNFLGGYQVVPAVFKHHNTYCSYADTIMPQFFFAVGFAYRLTFLRRLAAVALAGRSAAVLRAERWPDPARVRALPPRRRRQVWAELRAGLRGFLPQAFAASRSRPWCTSRSRRSGSCR